MGNCCLEPGHDQRHELTAGSNGYSQGYQQPQNQHEQQQGHQQTNHYPGSNQGGYQANQHSYGAPASNPSSRQFSLSEVLNVLNDVRGNPQKYAALVQRKYIDDLDQ